MTLDPKQREALIAAGQGEALARLDALDPGKAAGLARQLNELDVALVSRLAELSKKPPGGTGGARFEPPELVTLEGARGDGEGIRSARARGVSLLESGKVGFCLVAGGQASRLGYDAPKGVYPIGPVSERSLFEWHAHRLHAAARRHGVSVPWYVMTSPANDASTRAYFESRGHFGLDPADVFFFSQDMLPALDAEGRVLFSSADSLFLAPNGHGGCLLGLASSGALDDMRRRGLEQLSYFQVDNPLVRPADPLFLGLHAEADAGMSSKVVSKRDAGEKVGVLGRIDGAMGCIEYSDLPEDLREARDDTGALRFRAGNIAVHALSVDFVESVTRGGLDLPWHVARKNMKVTDASGAVVEAAGCKFETFVFDALASSGTSVTLEVDRTEEFSPVKNAEGSDSPASCRADLGRLFAGWAASAGLPDPPRADDGSHRIEVDPRLAETAEEFHERAAGRAPAVEGDGHLYA